MKPQLHPGYYEKGILSPFPWEEKDDSSGHLTSPARVTPRPEPVDGGGVNLKPPVLTRLLAPRCSGSTASTCRRRSSSTCSSTMTKRSRRRFPTTTSCVPSCSRRPGGAALGQMGASRSVPKTSKTRQWRALVNSPELLQNLTLPITRLPGCAGPCSNPH